MVIFSMKINSWLVEFYMNFKIIYVDIGLLMLFAEDSGNGEANIQTYHAYADRGCHITYPVCTRKNVHCFCIKISGLKGRMAVTAYCNFRSFLVIVTTQLFMANFYSCFSKASKQTTPMFGVYKTARNCVKFWCVVPTSAVPITLSSS